MEAAQEGFHGVATAKTNNEDLPHLWEECRPEQQLAEASSAEIAQETIIWECGQRHDNGNTQGFGCIEDY